MPFLSRAVWKNQGQAKLVAACVCTGGVLTVLFPTVENK